MNLLSDFVIKYRRLLIGLFAVLTLISVVLFLGTGINYNMMDYLPEEANSTQALTVMEKEFDQPMPNLNVMVEDVTLTEAMNLKNIIVSADFVKDVMWLDDVIDLKTPVEIQDAATTESYYKDGSALYMVAVEDGKLFTYFGSLNFTESGH